MLKLIQGMKDIKEYHADETLVLLWSDKYNNPILGKYTQSDSVDYYSGWVSCDEDGFYADVLYDKPTHFIELENLRVEK